MVEPTVGQSELILLVELLAAQRKLPIECAVMREYLLDKPPWRKGDYRAELRFAQRLAGPAETGIDFVAD